MDIFIPRISALSLGLFQTPNLFQRRDAKIGANVCVCVCVCVCVRICVCVYVCV
jgi:hypothetical protein